MIDALMKWRRRRRKVKEANQFLRETERTVRRGKRNLQDEARGQIVAGQQQLRAAVAAGDLNGIDHSAKALDELVDKHLAPFRKSQLREYVESVGFAVLVALTLRALVIEAFKIP